MAEENKNLQNNADGIPEDIDELLANAGKSLSELSDQVGQEEKESVSSIELEKEEKTSDVDSILSSLAAELENIGEDITGDDSDDSDQQPAEQPEDSQEQSDQEPVSDSEPASEQEPAASDATPADTVDVPSESESSFEDPLAELAAELEELNGEALKDIDDQNNAEQPESFDQPQSESVEDIVESAIEEQVNESASEETPEELSSSDAKGSEDTENTESAEDSEETVDDVLARLANEIDQEQIQEQVDQDLSANQSEPEPEANNIVEDELAEKEQVPESVSELPVESDEAVEAVEEVDSLGDEETSADAELDEMASEVEKVLDGFSDAVAEDDEGLISESQDQVEVQETSVQGEVEKSEPEPVIDDDMAKQLADLSDMLDNGELEDVAKEDSDSQKSELSESDVKDDSSDQLLNDSEKVMPHAEDVLNDLDKQMSDLNELVSEEVEASDEMDDIVLQELEDKTSPKKAEKKKKPLPFAEEAGFVAEKPAAGGMNPAQRAVISGLQATNKPFEKVVKGQAKDTLGLVAILTFAISIATLGFYLLFGGNQY